MKAAAELQRVDLSVGSFDMIRFSGYDHSFPKHAHEFYTVGVFDTDAGSLWYRGSEWQAARNSILAVSPEEVHAAAPGRREGWTYRAFYPSAELVGKSIALFQQPVLYDPWLAVRIVEVHRRLTAGHKGLEVEEQLLAVLRLLVQRHGSGWKHEVDVACTTGCKRARDYIESNYARPIKLADISLASGMSPFHLVRSFRATYGLPPHAYLTQVRAKRARAMLLDGETLATVAYRCGFCDQSHLTRAFRGIYGVTPGVYAKNSLAALAHHRARNRDAGVGPA